MKIAKFLVFPVVVLLLSGCVAVGKVSMEMDQAAKELVPPEGKALVYLMRTSALGSAVAMDVECNRTYIGTTGSHRFIYVVLDPGAYEFAGMAENVCALNLDVEAGQTYYILQDVLMGVLMARCRLILLDQEEGRDRLERCALSVNCEPDALQK